MNIDEKVFIVTFIFLILFFVHSAFATSIALPIINQNDFQACIWGVCQTVAPAWLYTDINESALNLTSSNITYNVTNSTIYNVTIAGANVSSTACDGTDKISAIDNATGIVTCSSDETGGGGGEPLWNGNYSLVAFLSDQSLWNVNSSNYANNSNYLNGLPSSTFYNASNPSGYISSESEFNGNYSLLAEIGTCPSGQFVQNTTATGDQCAAPSIAESETMFNGNYSLFNPFYNQTTPAITFGVNTFYNASNPSGYISNESQWNANYSNMITNNTMKTCSETWGQLCNNSAVNDSFSPCDGTQNGSLIIQEVYINASSFFGGDGINVTCTATQGSGRNNTINIWYNDTNVWYLMGNWTNTTLSTGTNYSVSFKINSTEGVHAVRCMIRYCSSAGPCPITGSCVNNSYASFYDNDDVNFTVISNSFNVNNSFYLNNNPSSYYWNITGGIPFTNITLPSNCSAGQYMNGSAASGWFCGTPTYNTSTEMRNALNNSAGLMNMSFSNATLNASSYIKIYNTTGLASCVGANATYSFMILSTC